jgi:ribosome-associated protein
LGVPPFHQDPIMIPVTDTLRFDDSEIHERFVRAGGPGGQNINRDATAVELRLDLRTSSLPSDLKARLLALAGRRVTTDDVLVVVGRASRSQAQNRQAARDQLVALLKRAAKSPKKRTATKLSRATRQKRLVAKERRSAVKHARKTRDESE